MPLYTLRACLFAVTLIATTLQSAPAPAGNPGVPWPATDALGRRLPMTAKVGPSRPDRFVAIFYFLWHEGKAKFLTLLGAQVTMSDASA